MYYKKFETYWSKEIVSKRVLILPPPLVSNKV